MCAQTAARLYYSPVVDFHILRRLTEALLLGIILGVYILAYTDPNLIDFVHGGIHV
jgi:hypothetical protein